VEDLTGRAHVYVEVPPGGWWCGVDVVEGGGHRRIARGVGVQVWQWVDHSTLGQARPGVDVRGVGAIGCQPAGLELDLQRVQGAVVGQRGRGFGDLPVLWRLQVRPLLRPPYTC